MYQVFACIDIHDEVCLATHQGHCLGSQLAGAQQLAKDPATLPCPQRPDVAQVVDLAPSLARRLVTPGVGGGSGSTRMEHEDPWLQKRTTPNTSPLPRVSACLPVYHFHGLGYPFIRGCAAHSLQ
jgi:hypothetical protein